MTSQPTSGSPGGNRREQERRPPPPNLPDILQVIAQKGYFDDNGNVRPEIIQAWPRVAAQAFKQGGLKSTQLRRFFNKARAVEQKLKSGQSFDRLKEEIQTLKPLAAAAVGKGNAPELFNRFMEVNVREAVKSPEAFTRGFIIHLQSIVAYTKYLEEKKGGP